MIICPQKVIPDVLHFLNVQYPYLFLGNYLIVYRI